MPGGPLSWRVAAQARIANAVEQPARAMCAARRSAPVQILRDMAHQANAFGVAGVPSPSLQPTGTQAAKAMSTSGMVSKPTTVDVATSAVISSAPVL